MVNVFIFLSGLLVGSFLNCVIYRLEVGEVHRLLDLRSRSYCPHCKHVLGLWDLVPLLSFLWLLGKCRYCKAKISWQYPLVEIATGALFLSIFTAFSVPFSVFYCLVSAFLIIIFVYDFKHYIIPDKVIFSAISLALAFNFSHYYVINLTLLLNPLLAGLGAASFFLAIVLVSKGKWMGVGDIKLAFLMGLVLGFPNVLVALVLAFLVGAIVGVVLMILGKKTMKSEVPFGPFLVGGTIVALFFGEYLFNWYVQSFYLN